MNKSFGSITFGVGVVSFCFSGVLLAAAVAAPAPEASFSLPLPTSIAEASSSGFLQQLAAQAQQQLVKQQKPQPAPAGASGVSAEKSAEKSKETSAVSNGVAASNADKQNVSIGDMNHEAFSGVTSQVLPMTPEQVMRLRQIFNESQKAAAMPPGIPPRPVTSSLSVNLSPQASPPVIRLGAGYITSLVFMDSTGQPWPIQAYSIGDPAAFNIQWDKKGNTLLIQASSFFKRSNLAVIMNGLDTPVMLTLLSGQEVIDYRVDLRVPGMGPNATFTTQNGLPDSANPILLDVLNGIPPKGSKPLRVFGGEGYVGECKAWLLDGRLFLRTSLDVISPAWKSVMSSADGTHAYELQPTPVVLVLQRGKDKTLALNIEGFE